MLPDRYTIVVTSQSNLREYAEPRLSQLTHISTAGERRNKAHGGEQRDQQGRITSLETRAAAHREDDPRPRADLLSPRPGWPRTRQGSPSRSF